ncbi:uncharacterized protein IL334_004943 [Kwoniella shivajii]|uniref:Transcription factor TFIIIC triple barrel domain-containing protein n=1 Tax=Kwoniella shivajii TaxID=564305 RepID=A0ABZ1D3N2_9TREE|nr:hypothetical protein IL334_004943 [Kwoniella shivajii]
MLQSSEDAHRLLEQGQSLFGEGWNHVNSFDEIDEDEYEDEEEEIYVTMDLGPTIDSRALQTETQYQLVGLDSPLPFLKVGNQIFQGQVTPLIGDEVILGLIRNSDNPHEPSHPPLYSTNHRITFQAITLKPQFQSQSALTDPPPLPPTSFSDPDAFPSSAITGDRQVRRSSIDENAIAGPSSSSHPSASIGHENTSSITGIDKTDGIGMDIEIGSSSSSSRIPQRRQKGTYKPRMSINNQEELENFDLKSMKTSQKVELGPEVLSSLGLEPSPHGERLSLSKSVMAQVISGYPSVGQGSRGGRGKKGKSWGIGRGGRFELMDNREQSADNEKTAEGTAEGTANQEQQEDQMEVDQNNIIPETRLGSAQAPTSVTTPAPAKDIDQMQESVTAQRQQARPLDQVQEMEEDPPWQSV